MCSGCGVLGCVSEKLRDIVISNVVDIVIIIIITAVLESLPVADLLLTMNSSDGRL